MSGTQRKPSSMQYTARERGSLLQTAKQQARNYEAAPSLTDDTIYSFLSALDCPRSLTVWLLWSSKEYEQLVALDVDPMHFNTAWQFRDCYAATLLLSKADFIPLSVSKRDAALQKFFKYEELCKQTNSRLRNLALDTTYNGVNASLLHATTRKISQLLGEFSPEEWVESCNWGPGSSTLLRGAHVSAANKFDADNGITSALYSFVGDWFELAYPGWNKRLTANNTAESRFDIQAGNKIVTVAKNSKTDRVIAIEPGINLWFQLGLGKMIRRRLLRGGVDLTKQSRNQTLSERASIIPEWDDGSIATIDFSSASDSISLQTVRHLFSGDWLTVLESCRSPLGTLDSKPVQWQKFSSMGNGYTFELESLIFYAAALSVKDMLGCSGEVSVYGDDVILPTQCVSTFRSFCAFLGFVVNDEKSFSSSQFRESCGSHYFNGYDVKPIYLKSRLSTLSSIYKLANSVRMFAHRCNSLRSCDARFRHCFTGLVKRVPKNLRFRIPQGYGDGGFVSNFDEATPSRARHGHEGFRVMHLAELSVSCAIETEGLYLARLKAISSHPGYIQDVAVRPGINNTFWSSDQDTWYHRIPDSDLYWCQGRYDLRRKTRQRLAVVHIHQWYNLGPWE